MKPLRVFFVLFLAACDPAPVNPVCAADGDCAAGERCRDGACVARPDAGETGADGGDDAGACECDPGEVCRATGCVAECQDPAAEGCGVGRVCDFLTGACADEGAPGILTGEGARCGDGPLCLPGTECDLEGECAPAPPCFAKTCTDDGSTCWGRSCLTERPAGACSVAPLDQMNTDAFVRGGDGGAFDLEFDDACNAYVVTMISGTDYLRQLAPDGTLTIWNGVTNLNMGEVAVRRIQGDEFGTGDGEGQVALTYVCCATCGCVSDDPQGVARLDRVDPTTSLPMVVTANPSPGDGPFQRAELDTGPYGLTWGRDNTLYVGNVTAQGDLVRADLDLGTTAEIHRLPARIHASTVFDRRALLVAVDEGVVHRVATDSDRIEPWAEIGEDVTSMVRDPFTGRIYVSVTSGRILELTPDGTLLGEWENPGSAGRLAYAPDGYLYYLISGWPTRAEVLRYALPTTL